MVKKFPYLTLHVSLNRGRAIHGFGDIVCHHIYVRSQDPKVTIHGLVSDVASSLVEKLREQKERVTIDMVGYQVQVKPLFSSAWVPIPTMQIPPHRSDAIWIGTTDIAKHPLWIFGQWRLQKIEE